MTARAAVYKLLKEDIVLQGAPYSLNENRIWPNFSMDVSMRDGYYLIMRWGPFSRVFGKSGKQRLTIWGYVSRYTTTDFITLSEMMMRVEEVLFDNVGVVGDDGWIFNAATFLNRSADTVDEGYDALAKSSEFEISARKEV